MFSLQRCRRTARRILVVSGLGVCSALLTSACADNALLNPNQSEANRALARSIANDTCRAVPSTLNAPDNRASDVLLDEGGDYEPITPDEPLDKAVSDECDDEYNYLIARCRTLKKWLDRKICYVAAMDWWINCKYPWKTCDDESAADVQPIDSGGSEECDGDPSGGGTGSTGGDPSPEPSGSNCGYETWEISYDGGITWQYWGEIWTCVTE